MVLTIEEIENVLKKNLLNISDGDIKKTAQALIAASGKWQEVNLTENLGAGLSVQCKDICCLGEAYSKGYQIRAFITEKK